ncbi:kinase-like domain-containing protein [Phialemonium atrogriseum]|uniref:EKC/KEOPS complex subunit BUD32 n=1 Tax=Phialemonium atrogriseum TaxID=1093897 RepID=A0AAJ0BV22_9PEZI|nr:kinase-like domain-containing protein [Phialemonium atrogriseum]KAK1763908.1 kinase-like domain-containing protein [Phialemonium atrogriseum]
MSAPSEASTNPAEILSSFATLAPDNPAAHGAFEAVVTYVGGDPESYHGGFITRSEDDPESPGHYVFTFDQLPEVTQGFWRIGKGTSKIDTTRGVDILLARPGHNSASLVANVHAVILLHPDSGAFILRSTSKHPIRYLSGDGDDDLILRHGEQAVLHMTANRFRFGPLDYLFTFRVEDETRFTIARDAFIQSVTQPASSDPPHPQLDRLPRQVHHRIRDVIIHKTMGHGAFGMVKSGIHARTGQPLAIKLLQWKSGAKGQIDRELEIAKLFRDVEYPGIIPILDAWCEHGCSPPCRRYRSEEIFMSMPLARHDFAHADWSGLNADVRLALFRDTLRGVESLHSRGVMHRDISPGNLLILSLDPPMACLCDFGKATTDPTSTETGIGPEHTVAPEVWTSTPDRPYTNGVDIWSLAYTWLWTISRLPDWNRSPQCRMDARRHGRLLDLLGRETSRGKISRSLAGLLRRMLAFDPDERPTASEALAEEDVWAAVAASQRVVGAEGSPDLGLRSPSPEQREAGKRRRFVSPEGQSEGCDKDAETSYYRVVGSLRVTDGAGGESPGGARSSVPDTL